MPLWSKTEKPKWLTNAEKANVTASKEGWVYKHQNGTQELLVSIAGLSLNGVELPTLLGFNTTTYPMTPTVTLPSDWATSTALTPAVGSIGITPEQLFDRYSTARSAPTTTYYVGAGGVDANNGTSPATKKLSITSAITAGNATGQPYKIIPDSMELVRNLGFGGVSPTQDIAIIPASGGRLVTGIFDAFGAMALDATYTNCYSLTIGAADRVCNRLAQNAYGNNVDFQLYASATALNAATLTNSGYAYEGGKIYMRRLDGAVPTPTNTRLYRSAVKNFSVTAEVNVYIENLDLEGGQVGAFEYIRSVASANKRIVVGKNCTFKYGGGNINVDGRSLSVDGINGLAAFFNCTANAAKTDGFNFHDIAGNGTQHLTVNCIGNDNGRVTGASCNGLTGHELTIGLDIGGTYRGNRGGTIRGSTGKLLVAGTIVADDLGDVILGGGTAPTAILTNGSEYWLDRVKIIMPAGQQAILSTGTGKVHKRDVIVANNAAQGGSGTIDTY